MQQPGAPKGRNALVTGGLLGIGFCTASALARLGATAYLAGCDTSD
jgi:NAD(P)-dependent dehydrogenase (short-subunit alcohol dehydrogenase family)